MQNACAIVLAGGRSSRMGLPKAALDWHGTPLARRVTGILARSVSGPVVVVRAPGQELPPLAADVELVEDARPGRGPLQGLAAGLAAVAARAPVAYLSSVDVPLLHPAFVRAVIGALDDEVDVAVPDIGGRLHPLAAAYRVSVRDMVEELLARDQLSLHGLLDRCRARRVTQGELPNAYSVTNLNQPGEYESALELRAPGVEVDGAVLPAWRLGDVLEGHRVVRLNGEPVDPDPELPLVAGDMVSLG